MILKNIKIQYFPKASNQVSAMSQMSPTPPASNNSNTSNDSPPVTPIGRPGIVQPWLASYIEMASHQPNWTSRPPPQMGFAYRPGGHYVPNTPQLKPPEWSAPAWAHNLMTTMNEPISLVSRNSAFKKASLRTMPQSRSVSPNGQ